MKVKDVWNVLSTDNDLDVIDIETGEVYAYTDAVNGNRNLYFPEYEDMVLNTEVVKLEVAGVRSYSHTITAWVDLYKVIYG